VARELFHELDDPKRRVRLIGVSLTGFDGDAARQLSMFDAEGDALAAGPDDSDIRIAGAMDALNDRFGRDSVTRAALLDGKMRRKP